MPVRLRTSVIFESSAVTSVSKKLVLAKTVKSSLFHAPQRVFKLRRWSLGLSRLAETALARGNPALKGI